MVFHLNPQKDWSSIPLDTVLVGAFRDQQDTEGRRSISQTEPVLIRRPGLTIAWNEPFFLDSDENREAYSLALLAHGALAQTLITLDFWLDDAALALQSARIAFEHETSLGSYMRAQKIAGESWDALRPDLLACLR